MHRALNPIKRALHNIKRALHNIKRAPPAYTIIRALHACNTHRDQHPVTAHTMKRALQITCKPYYGETLIRVLLRALLLSRQIWKEPYKYQKSSTNIKRGLHSIARALPANTKKNALHAYNMQRALDPMKRALHNIKRALLANTIIRALHA